MYGYEIFHEDLMKSLIRSVRAGTSSHAYIFEGAAGLGIFSSARLFAAALACENTETAPCGACPSCIEEKARTNPDIIFVRPDKDKKTIGAGNMRAMEEDAAIKPFAARRKVYIIEDGSLLTEAAQNVFLKTLEEPPGYAAFIIVAENADTLLQTIRSRSVIVHFPPISDSRVREYIRSKYPGEAERLEFLVKYCAGIPLTADKVIADENFDRLRSDALQKLPLLISTNALDAFEFRQFAEENKDSLTDLIDFWISYLRDILLIQAGAADRLINTDKQAELKNMASRTSPEKITAVIDRLVTAAKMSARYVSVKAVSLWLAL